MAQTLQSQLEEIVQRVIPVPEERKYWMVRTQQGTLYGSFRQHGFIALEHNAIEKNLLLQLRQSFHANEKGLREYLRDVLTGNEIEKKQKAALVAGQIIRFTFGIKKGDIVVIPSVGSSKVSFGEVLDSTIYEASPEEIANTGCDYVLRKKVQWIDDFSRDRLDPYLYKMFLAHQAINDITQYAEIIERNLRNFFIQDGNGNLVLNVETLEKISARQLFKTGNDLLDYVEYFIRHNGMSVDLNDIEVKINLNSPGKIHFKAPKASTIFLVAIVTVGLFGGGLKIHWGDFNLDLTTKGLIQAVIDYQNDKHDRQMKERIMKNVEGLKMKSPDDAVKILQQLSPNKNLPK